MRAADVRLALRGLAQRPGFTATALLTLAVGIGANAAVFSIAQAVLLRPLPFREPDRLVLVWERNVGRDRQRNVVNPGNYLAWRERAAAFESIAAFTSGTESFGDPSARMRPLWKRSRSPSSRRWKRLSAATDGSHAAMRIDCA